MGVLQDILRTLSLPEFYFAMFRSATPVLLTTLGAMVASRAGTNNIALEGTMLISAFVGVVVLILACRLVWVGGVQPGGVVLCIILFNTPVETYVSYALNRIFDTGVGVLMALFVNGMLPGGFTFGFMHRFYLRVGIPDDV